MAILKSKQARAGHAAGIFSDMTLDGPEIGTLVAVVDRAKNLPNRRAIGKQDPYCAMRLGKEAKKTETDRRGGQTPRWDQELRFTVHDSPDYYKLKCSIFNDDKKTELIGETWIDLTEVIKLGGGKSDAWQQLVFKSKYAGEIRVELTFYDTREQPQERKRSRDRQETGMADTESEVSLPASRSLGPREIKRRPLPANPTGPSSTHNLVSRVDQVSPHLPPKIPLEDRQPQPIHAPVPSNSRGRSSSPLPPPQPQDGWYDQHEQYEQYEQDQLYYSQQSHHQNHHRAQSQPSIVQQPWQYSSGQQHRDYQPDLRSHRESVSGGRQARQPDFTSAQYNIGSVYPGEEEIWQHQRPSTVHMHSEPVTPQFSSPGIRPLPTSVNSDSQLVRLHQERSDMNPSRDQVYADSPLRQSVSQSEMYSQPPHMDAPPPLPPKHRDTPPRRPKAEYPPSAYIPQPLRIGQKRSSVGDRSPLQSLEDDYDLQRHEPVSAPHTPLQQNLYDPVPSQHFGVPQQQVEPYGRRRTYEMQSSILDSQTPPQRPRDHNSQGAYENRRPSFSQQIMEEPQPMTPQDSYHSGHEDAYQPFVEDAPPSPGLQPAVARKAVGTLSKKLNTVPFGPDAYDVLNPASSPVTNDRTRFQTSEQAKEADRLREVEKIRGLGPIIGNDGREIDPSDHLPSDTWAPEPEWKNRKPEHVIHIRSKNGASKPAGARASPVVVRHNNNSTPTSLRNSPAPASSPAPQTTPSSFVGGRVRFQKPTSTQARASPQQQLPYSLPAGTTGSSPMLASPIQHIPYDDEADYNRPPAQPRRPSFDNRTPDHPNRPPLSEYQVPVGNSYQPRSNSYNTQDYQQKILDYTPRDMTPNRPSPQPDQVYPSPSAGYQSRESYDRRNSYNDRDRRGSYDDRNDYSYENHHMNQIPKSRQEQPQQRRHYDDPLAAEMSMIDIGPSRSGYQQASMGRSMAKRW